jgi:hypothetical protein
MPPYIPSLVAVRYRNHGFVRREQQHFNRAACWYGWLVLDSRREVHGVSVVVDTHLGGGSLVRESKLRVDKGPQRRLNAVYRGVAKEEP